MCPPFNRTIPENKRLRPRRQKELETRRQDILDAAADLFYQQGFHRTTVRQIADQADFGVGTVYRLFAGGKDAIFRAVQERVVAYFERTATEWLAGATDPRDTLRRYIRAGAHVYETYPRETTLYIRDTVGLKTHLDRGLEPDLAARYLACAEPAVQALRQGAAQGLFRRLDPDLGIVCLRALINAALCVWLDAPDAFPLERNIDLVESLFFHGVNDSADAG